MCRTSPPPGPRNCTHDVDGDASHGAVGLGRQVLEDVGSVCMLQQLERHGQVMIFEHRVIVVHQRQLQTYFAYKQVQN